MPPRRKIDLLPAELRDWLKAELEQRGFAGYDEVHRALNDRLAEAGLGIGIGRAAVARYGAEHAEFVRFQAEASGWAAGWLDEAGLEEEARRQSVLFQMITTIAFKVLKSQMTREGDEIDPRDLQSLGRMMRDVMASSGLREVMSERERRRLADAERRAGAERADAVARGAGISPEVAAAIRAAVEGGTPPAGQGAAS